MNSSFPVLLLHCSCLLGKDVLDCVARTLQMLSPLLEHIIPITDYPAYLSSRSLVSSGPQVRSEYMPFLVIDPVALLYNHLLLCVFCTKLQVCSRHWLHPLWFCTPLHPTPIHCQGSVFARSPFGLYSQRKKALHRPFKSSIYGRGEGTQESWTFWAASAHWHSGKTYKLDWSPWQINCTRHTNTPRSLATQAGGELSQCCLSSQRDVLLFFHLPTISLLCFPKIQLGGVATYSTQPISVLASTVSIECKATFPINPNVLDFVIIDR